MKSKQDLDVALEAYIQERVEQCESVWVDYEPEIRILSNTMDCSRIKTEKLIDKINSLPEINALKKKLENVAVSNRTLIEECDYLRNQLRREDIIFYEILDLRKAQRETDKNSNVDD